MESALVLSRNERLLEYVSGASKLVGISAAVVAAIVGIESSWGVILDHANTVLFLSPGIAYAGIWGLYSMNELKKDAFKNFTYARTGLYSY